jgi:four helix bundle protein
MKSYKNLIVWQKSIELVERIFLLTKAFPTSETYGLTSQMKRAAISIPSNIAEGYGRKSHKEYLQFYAISYGSALELETQLIIARKLAFITNDTYLKNNNLLTEIIKMLYVLVYKNEKGGVAIVEQNTINV